MEGGEAGVGELACGGVFCGGVVDEDGGAEGGDVDGGFPIRCGGFEGHTMFIVDGVGFGEDPGVGFGLAEGLEEEAGGAVRGLAGDVEFEARGG